MKSNVIGPFAHSSPHGTNWESLFTPLGEEESFCHGDACAACEKLDPNHGHLNKVAFWAGRFATNMFPEGTEDAKIAALWGRNAGMWHDLGKFAVVWQEYLKHAADPHQDEAQSIVDHSTAGAQHADTTHPPIGRFLAYIIAGHHAGLPNGLDTSMSCLGERLRKDIADFSNAPPDALNTPSDLSIPSFALKSSQNTALFTRFIFSCLVDADFLATESFMAPLKHSERVAIAPSFEQLEEALHGFLGNFGPADSPVNIQRERVRAACLESARHPTGLFSLTVPTGGGKTLSSLAFALRHARKHGLQRIIYVMPFTTIIEQNAAVFRSIFEALGDEVVIEHHTGLDPEEEHATQTSRLLSENWDARIIVTTNVQFFESLHANRTSRCRKLHRLARSVIILDEAQALPLHLLDPCLRSLEGLVEHFGSTVLLCTATQPALHRRDDFPEGLSSPREIVSDPPSLYEALRRVRLIHRGSITREKLAVELASEHQALCIVNTRRQAREIYELLGPDKSMHHLSALMCPSHRSDQIKTIHQQLKSGQRTILVSTQLIEAGVDIDFPVVFRIKAGLDSIAQAAGRCDREGRLTVAEGQPAGRLYLFDLGELPPPGFLRRSAQSTDEVAATFKGDLLSLEAMEQYFMTHLWRHRGELDLRRIRDCWPDRAPEKMRDAGELFLFQFKECGKRFKIIDDASMPVIIPFGDKGKSLCRQLESCSDPRILRQLSRKLQRFTVTIPIYQHTALRNEGAIEIVHDIFYILNSLAHYSLETGLQVDPNRQLSVDTMVL